jgi:phosphomannomutase
MAFADSLGISLIVANDPDADRLAVSEKQNYDLSHSESDAPCDWYNFTGNEIGVILGHWQIMKAKDSALNEKINITESSQLKKRKVFNGRKAVLASIVSSRMLKTIATVEGIEYYDTLTGFKWLGNKSIELQEEGVEVLFSYEEALGYCVGDLVCDKDGISAAAVFVEIASALKQKV